MATNSIGGIHGWESMNDEELLRSVGLYGTDDVIRDVCPAYETDALARKHLPDKFFLEGTERKNLRNIITREVIGNTLIHNYSSAFPAKVIIEKDWLKTENWCITRRHGNIMSDEFTPYPKKPLIQQFFCKHWQNRYYWLRCEKLVEVRITIPLDKMVADEAREQKTLSEREQKIYNMICENIHLSEQVMAELDISRATVYRDYAKNKKVTGAMYGKNVVIVYKRKRL